MRVIDKVDYGLPRLSKLEWLVALGSSLLMLSAGMGLSLAQTGDFITFFLWDLRSCAIALVICVVLGSIKPRSDKLSETFADRFAWAAQYASFFLTFTVIGSLIFERNLKEVGPLISLALNGYLFCSVFYIVHLLLKQIWRNNFEGNTPSSRDFGVVPLCIASVLIACLNSFALL